MKNLPDREKALIEETCIKIQSQIKRIIKSREVKNYSLKQVGIKNQDQIIYQFLIIRKIIYIIRHILNYFKQIRLSIRGSKSQQSDAKLTRNHQGRQQEEDLNEKSFAIIQNIEEKADTRATFCLFRVILDPILLQLSKCAILIKEYLEEKFQEKEIDYESMLIAIYEKSLTFKPSINPISEHYNNNQIKRKLRIIFIIIFSIRENELYRKKELTNYKIENLNQEKIMKDIQECTFKLKQYQKKNFQMQLIDYIKQRIDKEQRKEQNEQNQRKKSKNIVNVHFILKLIIQYLKLNLLEQEDIGKQQKELEEQMIEGIQLIQN
ncbi:unnamed protein product [Paramecium sonneborni]|uniref:Uncharacterized protein n=1 Tax=Paramecium sonneborni TaxID=65129 RepID=A0A8S1RH45_9CILI|nr:unnamed protein product [Paramecium sonneborni]